MHWGGTTISMKSLCLLIFLSIQLFSFSSASFLPKREEIIQYDNFQYRDLNFLRSNYRENNENLHKSYQQIALETLLSRYNYSVFWYDDKSHSLIPSFIIHQCYGKDVNLLLACSLDFVYLDKQSPEIMGLQFNLNQAVNSYLESDNSTVIYKDVQVKVGNQVNSSLVSEKICTSDFAYYFVNKKTRNPYNYTFDSTSVLSVQVELKNGTCDFNRITPLLSASIKADASEIIQYTLMMTGVALIQVISCGIMIRKFERNSPIYKRTSIGTLCFLIVFDFFIYLIHFTYWTTVSVWMSVIFIIFFVAAVFIEPVILYHLFSTLQRRTNAPTLNLLFQIYSWLLISGGCIILSVTCCPNFIFYAYPFFLVPQILDNFLTGRKYKWNLWLIGGLGLPKLFYIAYLSMDPVDMFNKGFTKQMMIYSCVIITITLIALKIQRKYPTFGIKRLMPEQYSYLFDLNNVDHSTLDVCSICTEKVTQSPIIGLQQPLMEQESQVSEIYRTPCEHHFHMDCLKEWLKKKLECPNCRQMLPPLNDDEDDE